MASTAYVLSQTLRDGHSETVNCVCFSPDGTYLASGGDDCSVIIWNVHKGLFLYRVVFDSAIDCLLWHPTEEETLIVGCQNGCLYQLCSFSLASALLLPRVQDHSDMTAMSRPSVIHIASISASEAQYTALTTVLQADV